MGRGTARRLRPMADGQEISKYTSGAQVMSSPNATAVYGYHRKVNAG